MIRGWIRWLARRKVFLATLCACFLVIVCAICVYWGWFGFHLYGSLSRSPQAWAYFAAFFAAASIPVLASIAIAANIAGQYEERLRADEHRLVNALTDLLDCVTPSSTLPAHSLAEVALGAQKIFDGPLRPLPHWARAVLATRFRLAVHDIYGVDSKSFPDWRNSASHEWQKLFTSLEGKS